MREGYIVAVDIGATKMRVALMRKEAVLAKREVKTPADVKIFAKVLKQLISYIRSSSSWDKVLMISIATIGPLDLERGVITNTPNLGGLTIDLPSLLTEFNKPFIIVNDCVAAIWGEKLWGKARHYSNAIYVTISTGIGGGIITDNNLLLGKSGNAHEIGHIVVDAERKLQCGCGGWGHWEAYGGGGNIPRFVKYIVDNKLVKGIENSIIARMVEREELDAKKLYGLAKTGNKYALAVIKEVNKYHVAGFESIINMYDPEIIIVGGSIAFNNYELIVEPIRRSINNRKGLITSPPIIELASFGEDEVLVGASALAYSPPRYLLERLKYFHQAADKS